MQRDEEAHTRERRLGGGGVDRGAVGGAAAAALRRARRPVGQGTASAQQGEDGTERHHRGARANERTLRAHNLWAPLLLDEEEDAAPRNGCVAARDVPDALQDLFALGGDVALTSQTN